MGCPPIIIMFASKQAATKSEEPNLDLVADELLKEAIPIFEQMKKLESDIVQHRQLMTAEVAKYQQLIASPNREFKNAVNNFEQLLTEIERRQ